MTDLISKRQMVEKIDDLFLDKYEVKANSDLIEFYKEVLKILINEKVQSKWISVKHELPKDNEEVLVWFEYFRYGEYNRLFQTWGIGEYFKNYDTWMINHETGWHKLRVIAWLPIPELPESEGIE